MKPELRTGLAKPLRLFTPEANYVRIGYTLMKNLVFSVLAAFFLSGGMAQASPQSLVKIVNFTADWCPNCPSFNRKLDQVLKELNDPAIEIFDVDMTPVPARTPQASIQRYYSDYVKPTLEAHGAGGLYKGYSGWGGTGFAAIIASDTGEPLVCVTAFTSAVSIRENLKAAKDRVRFRPANQRVPEGPDCPPSFLR